MRSALIAGATGLVGGHLVRRLLADATYNRVTVLSRRTLPLADQKFDLKIVDFDRLASLAPFPRVDDVFICLGTTIKQAGSREAFYKVDFTYVHEIARLAALQGAKQLLLVSSLGAKARSSIFYSSVKGKIEEAVRALPYHSIHIFRPSLLLGHRSDYRAGEQMGVVVSKAFGWMLVGPFKKYRPIDGACVAEAMLRVAKENRAGVDILPSDAIQRLCST